MKKVARQKLDQALRNAIYAQGWKYAHDVVTNSGRHDPAIGAPPYSAIDAKTLIQRGYFAGFVEALRYVKHDKAKE
jgi:hypothetical protein